MGKRLVFFLIFVLSAATFLLTVKPTSAASQDTWTTKASMNVARFGLGVAVWEGKIYAIGGQGNVNAEPLSVNEVYDPASDTWGFKASMPTARSGFGIAVYQNKIYCIGGMINWAQGTVSSGANEVYDPATDTWSTLSPMPTARYGVEACVLGGKIYLIGGDSYAVEVYDPMTDTWTTKTSIPNAPGRDRAWSCALIVFENKIHVIGAAPFANSHQIYDPTTDSWSIGTPVIAGYVYASAAATTGENAPEQIYVFGASSIWWNLDHLPDVESQSYDPTTNSWTVGSSVPSKRIDFGSVVINDIIYTIGGFIPTYGNMINVSALNQQYIPLEYGTINNTTGQDITPPDITITSPENTTYNTTSIQLNYYVNESELYLRYKLDETVVELTGNTTLTNLSQGQHNITIYATDQTGNTAATETIYFTVTQEAENQASGYIIVLVAGVSGVAAVIVGIGLFYYFRKKQKH